MPIKPLHSLLAVLAFIAAPVYAQEKPATDAQGNAPVVLLPKAAGEAADGAKAMADEAQTAADKAQAAAAKAAEAVEGAMSDTKPAAEAEATPAAEEQMPADMTTTPETPPAAGMADSPDAAKEMPAEPPAQSPATTESAEPKIGSYYAKSTHNDWTIRCIVSGEDIDPCELFQQLKEDSGNPVAEMQLIPLKNSDAAALATLVAPLETNLIRGLGLAVDGGEMVGYPFSFCNPIGCYAQIGFSAAELNTMKRGAKATLSLLPFGADPKQPVNLTLSLSGFTAAFDELSKLADESQKKAN